MKYHQLTSEERYTIAQLKWQRFSCAEIAHLIGRHRTTVWREIQRNATRHDGKYRHQKADSYARARRSRSRRNCQFGPEHWSIVERRLRLWHSPEQISDTLKLERVLSISHEAIYQHVLRDQKQGGDLYTCLRLSRKQRRKRYRSRDSRGRLPGKRMIDERPAAIESRHQFGHWEIDTVMGKYGTSACILTLVERKTGYVLIGKLKNRSVEETNRRLLQLMQGNVFRSITADNGTEFHGYSEIEAKTPAKFYFAHPYHSWERGSNENINGLIRQYLVSVRRTHLPLCYGRAEDGVHLSARWTPRWKECLGAVGATAQR